MVFQFLQFFKYSKMQSSDKIQYKFMNMMNMLYSYSWYLGNEQFLKRWYGIVVQRILLVEDSIFFQNGMKKENNFSLQSWKFVEYELDKVYYVRD